MERYPPALSVAEIASMASGVGGHKATPHVWATFSMVLSREAVDLLVVGAKTSNLNWLSACALESTALSKGMVGRGV